MQTKVTVINLLKGTATFKNETPAFKIFVICVMAAIILASIYMIHSWNLPKLPVKGAAAFYIKNLVGSIRDTFHV